MSRTTTLRLKSSFHRRPHLGAVFLWTLGAAIAIGIGLIFIASNHMTVSQETRTPASLKTKNANVHAKSKHSHLMPASDMDIQRTAKLTPPVRTSLEMEPYLRSLSKGEEFTLKAKFKSKTPDIKILFQWSLPEGIELISGEKSGSLVLSQFTGEESEIPLEVSIQLRNTTETNLRIGFSIEGAGSEYQFSDHVQIQTQDELFWREKKARLKERAKQYMNDKGQLKRE